MAVSSTKTLLPLDLFAKYVGINPLHFNGIQVADLAESRVCGATLLQYSWQTADAVGREELAMAIADAEHKISEQVKFNLAPTWIADELVLTYHKSINPNGLYNTGYGYGYSYGYASLGLLGRGIRFANNLKLGSGYVISGGAEAWDLLASGAAVVYTDLDNDGYFETATCAVATDVIEASEIAVVYPGKSALAWELRPISVKIVAGIATIMFRREQAVIASRLEALDAIPVDGLDNTAFLTTIDIYRHWTDPSKQASLFYDNAKSSCNLCLGTGCEACGYALGTGCVTVQDSRRGIVNIIPSVWNADTQNYDIDRVCSVPDRIKVSYKAGLGDLYMSPSWARAVSYYALSLLDRPLCSCDGLKNFTQYWSTDLARSVGTPAGSTSWKLSKGMLDNPLGTTRAAIHAWRLVQQNMIGENVNTNVIAVNY